MGRTTRLFGLFDSIFSYVVSVLLYHFPFIICLNKKYVAPKKRLHMTLSPGSTGTYTSSKTPGRDMEDRWSLDRVFAVAS